MKICLVNPPLATEGAHYIPLGLAYIGAVMREKGCTVSVADAQFQSMEKVITGATDADIIGITSISHNFPTAASLAHTLRRTNPDAFIVMGGPHVTFTDAEVLNLNPSVDAIVRHEGETTFMELVNSLSNNFDLSCIQGITYREHDSIKRNPERPFIENLDSIPFPARDLFQRENYYTDESVVQIISGRGCPFQCVFCSCSSMWGHQVRLRSPENVVDEIEHVLKTYSINRFGFVDDTFTIMKKHTVEICEEIMRRGLDIQWACNVRVDTLNEELVNLMKKAGCVRFFMGIESGNQETLNFVKKKITVQQIRKAVELAHKYSIETVLSCILGFPNETYTDIEKTIDFMISLKGDRYFFNFLLLYPGTELYSRQEELKMTYIVDNPWERVEKTPFPIPTVETGYIDVYELSQLYLKAKARLELLKDSK